MNQQLITQYIRGYAVTVTQGQTPVINVPILNLSPDQSGHEELVAAVNFLRSGSAEVTLVMANSPEASLWPSTISPFLCELMQGARCWLFGRPESTRDGAYTVLTLTTKAPICGGCQLNEGVMKTMPVKQRLTLRKKLAAGWKFEGFKDENNAFQLRNGTFKYWITKTGRCEKVV